MITLKETREKIASDTRWWCIHLMNFVDDFRSHRDVRAIEDSFDFRDDKMDAQFMLKARASDTASFDLWRYRPPDQQASYLPL